MKKIYATEGTEHESGWGSRPMGYYLCNDKSELESFIKDYNKGGSYDCYYRCGSIFEIYGEESPALEKFMEDIWHFCDKEYKVRNVDSLKDIILSDESTITFFKQA
ncbi:MAG: hypothetical protein WC979_02385 [Candidatus Pacearchaeota archaeon]|jgi:hypothetical protein|nr:hypothetical protein [Clostridia bacterium]